MKALVYQGPSKEGLEDRPKSERRPADPLLASAGGRYPGM